MEAEKQEKVGSNVSGLLTHDWAGSFAVLAILDKKVEDQLVMSVLGAHMLTR